MSIQLFFKMFAAFMMSVLTIFSGAKQNVSMIAHRGYSGMYPENTELAFEKAAEHGSEGAETDVRMTKDGVFVVSHNSEVVLKDGTKLKVSDSTYEELTAQPLKNRKTLDKVYLCTFEKYLEVMKKYDMICFIELKGEFTDEQVNQVFTMAKEVYDLKKCIMQSFNFDNLIRVHEQFPEMEVMLTYGVGDEGYERCFDYGFSIDCDYQCITEEMIEEFHSRGLKVALWTANELLSLSYCKSLGVDFIESDFFG